MKRSLVWLGLGLALPLAGGCLVDIAGVSDEPLGTPLEAPDADAVDNVDAGDGEADQTAPDASLDDAPVVDAGPPDAVSDVTGNTIQEAGQLQLEDCVQGQLDLTDAFTSAGVNALAWTEYGTGSASGGPDGKLTIVADVGATKGIRSVKTFTFTPGCAATVAVDAQTNAAFALYAGAQSRVEIALEGTFLRARWLKNGVGIVLGTVPYDASQHRYWRFRESGGQLLIEVSPDANGWALLAQSAIMSDVRVQLASTYSSGKPGAAAHFDDLNDPP